VLVPFASGSGADGNTRLYGDLLSELWGPSVVVDNRPGGSGVVAAMAVKSAAPDGYILLTATTSTTAVNPVVIKDLPYDAIKNLRPVILFNLAPTVFLIRANPPNKTIKGSTLALHV
jgi:tripartite-type tricarboxylate transporter receptor subunit TctC